MGASLFEMVRWKYLWREGSRTEVLVQLHSDGILGDMMLRDEELERLKARCV